MQGFTFERDAFLAFSFDGRGRFILICTAVELPGPTAVELLGGHELYVQIQALSQKDLLMDRGGGF